MKSKWRRFELLLPAHDTMLVKEFAMPLRDHFRPPVSKKSSWEGFHAMWPTCIVQQLRKQLPTGFVAEPRVHLGTLMEIDLGALESSDAPRAGASSGNGNVGTTAAWTATLPAVSVETEPPDEYEYEVRIFDVELERRLVAAIEFVSPANKDRPESRDSFVAKTWSRIASSPRSLFNASEKKHGSITSVQVPSPSSRTFSMLKTVPLALLESSQSQNAGQKSKP